LEGEAALLSPLNGMGDNIKEGDLWPMGYYRTQSLFVLPSLYPFSTTLLYYGAKFTIIESNPFSS